MKPSYNFFFFHCTQFNSDFFFFFTYKFWFIKFVSPLPLFLLFSPPQNSFIHTFFSIPFSFSFFLPPPLIPHQSLSSSCSNQISLIFFLFSSFSRTSQCIHPPPPPTHTILQKSPWMVVAFIIEIEIIVGESSILD